MMYCILHTALSDQPGIAPAHLGRWVMMARLAKATRGMRAYVSSLYRSLAIRDVRDVKRLYLSGE